MKPRSSLWKDWHALKQIPKLFTFPYSYVYTQKRFQAPKIKANIRTTWWKGVEPIWSSLPQKRRENLADGWKPMNLGIPGSRSVRSLSAPVPHVSSPCCCEHSSELLGRPQVALATVQPQPQRNPTALEIPNKSEEFHLSWKRALTPGEGTVQAGIPQDTQPHDRPVSPMGQTLPRPLAIQDRWDGWQENNLRSTPLFVVWDFLALSFALNKYFYLPKKSRLVQKQGTSQD